MPAATARSRAKNSPGTAQLLAFGTLAFVILALTFALGLLVGRQWARQTPPAAAGEAARKAVSAPRRSGLGDVGMERPQVAEKLTFYHTLTAPLTAVPSSAKSPAVTKPVAERSRPVPERTPERVEPSVASGPPAGAGTPETPADGGAGPQGATAEGSASAASGLPKTDSGPAASPTRDESRRQDVAGWTVQVGAFKNRGQAESVRKQLADARFDAYVASSGAEEGQARYRVRVGNFKSREEALRVAERLHAERSLAAFVTPK